MKIEEWKNLHGIRTDEEMREFFRINIDLGQVPVAIATCLTCNHILWDYSQPCQNCRKKVEVFL